MASYVQAAAVRGQTPVLVAYHIPNRDCGGYSGGGATSAADYQRWVQAFAAGIGNVPSIVILEPDSLYVVSCLSAAQLAERQGMLKQAVATLRASAPRALVYLDGGTPSPGRPAADIAGRLAASGIQGARGIAVNISNYRSTAEAQKWAVDISSEVLKRTGAQSHYVIDTSRNGGSVTAGQWCNPPGARIGAEPKLNGGASAYDGGLWIKIPGESDGACGMVPNTTAGQFDPALAYSLIAG